MRKLAKFWNASLEKSLELLGFSGRKPKGKAAYLRRRDLRIETLEVRQLLDLDGANALDMVVDNQDVLAYFESGSVWRELYGPSPGAYQGNFRYSPKGLGSSYSTWTIESLDPAKQYHVWTTWAAGEDRASNALYTVLDTEGELAAVQEDQRTAPADAAIDHWNWQSLGIFQTAGDKLAVQLSDAGDGTVVADAVRVTEVVQQAVAEVGDAAYRETGGDWVSASESTAEQKGLRYHAPGGGSSLACWRFDRLDPSLQYRVLTTWSAEGDPGANSTNAPFSVLDGANALATVRMNQQVAPADVSIDERMWQSLGVYQAASGRLLVQVSDEADGRVIAGGVRIEAVRAMVARPDAYVTSEGTPLTIRPEQGMLANDDWGLSDPFWSLDLRDNFIMLPKPAGASAQETKAAVGRLLDRGKGGNGVRPGATGLHSSTLAAADAAADGARMGIVYADAAELGLEPGDYYYGRKVPPGGCVIGRYTYLGDSDLDGKLDDGEEGEKDNLPALPEPWAARPLTVSASTFETDHGTVTVEEDGSLVYVPDENYSGTDTFNYRVTNQATGASTLASVMVRVENAAPVVAITGVPGGEVPPNMPVTLGSSILHPGQGETFAYAWDVTKVAADGTTTEHFATGTAADFTFVPNQKGAYNVELVVTDSAGGTGRAEATIQDMVLTLYWDTNGDAEGLGDGIGTWSTGDARWNRNASGSGQTEVWTPGCVAVFAGTSGGAVTISSSVSANSIYFNTAGHTLSSGTLTLSGLTNITVGTGTTTINSTISGTGGISKQGGGVLSLTGTNTYTGGTAVNAGTLGFAPGSLGYSGGISFGGGTLRWATGNTQDISSRIASIPIAQYAKVEIMDTSSPVTFASGLTGGGGLMKLGGGALTLLASNIYTGGTTVSGGGTLRLGSYGSLSGNVTNYGNLEFANSLAMVYGGVISGPGTITKSGAGDLTLTNVNTCSGGTTISAGMLQLGSGGSNGSVAGPIILSNDARLRVVNPYDLTLSGGISGAGSLVKFSGGSSVLTLSGTNNYTGTTVGSGKLQVTGSLTGDVSVSGGANLTFANGSTLNFNGVISGAGSVTKSGAGVLTLMNTSSSYAGGTTISGGTLSVDGAGKLGTGGIAFSGGSGGSGGCLEITANNASWTKPITLLSGGTISVPGGVSVTMPSGGFSGSGGLTKAGGGTLTLVGSNSYAGGTAVNGGVLNFSPGALGSSGGISFGGGTLQWATGNTQDISSRIGFISSGQMAKLDTNGNAVTFNSPLSGGGGMVKLGEGRLTLKGTSWLSGGATVSAGTLRLGDGQTSNGAVSGGAIVNNSVLEFSNPYNQVYSYGSSGGIGGSGSLTKSGAGTLTLSGASTYAGNTTISEGTLVVTGGNDRLPTTTTVTLGSGGSNGVLQLGDGSGAVSQVLAGLATSGTGTANCVVGGAASTSTLTLNLSSPNAAFQGVLGGIGTNQNHLALVKTGASEFWLYRPNTYTGGTTISGGTLQATKAGALPGYNASNKVTVASGAMLAVSAGGSGEWTSTNVGDLLSANGANFTSGSMLGIDTTNATSGLTCSAVISGNLELVKLGANKLTLTGINAYSGGTNIAGGMLSVSADNNLGTGPITMTGCGLDISGSYGFYSSKTVTIDDDEGVVNVSGDQAVSFGGTITGRGKLVKTGDGPLQLSGTNTYIGGTEIAAGTLMVFRNENLGDSSSGVTLKGGILAVGCYQQHEVTIPRNLTLDADANIYVDFEVTANLTGNITGSGRLTLTGKQGVSSGVLVLSGQNDCGGTIVDDGTLRLGSDAALGQGNGSLVVNDWLSLNGHNAVVSSLSGGTNGYITGGNGTLTVNQSSDTTFAGVMADTLALTKSGSGTLTLSGANTYSGDTIISAGTLSVGSGAIPSGTGKGNVTVDGTLDLNGKKSITVNGLSGSGTVTSGVAGAVTLTVGDNDQTSVFSGTVQNGSGTVAVIKTGSGTLTLSEANTYTGDTTVAGGILNVTGSIASAVLLAGGYIMGSGAPLPALTASIGAITVDEGQPAAAGGTWQDPVIGAPLSFTASAGDVTADVDGTWNWECIPNDGPSSQTVTITASDGYRTATTSFALAVNNVAPSLSTTLDYLVSEGLSFSDPGFTDATAGTFETFTYEIQWDGGAQETGPATAVDGCPGLPTTGTLPALDRPGDHSVSITLRDDDGGFDTETFEMHVHNTVDIYGAPTVNEDDEYQLQLSDSGQWFIHWGDGSRTDVDDGSMLVSHAYADEGPNYTILAERHTGNVIDVAAPINVQVIDVRPTISISGPVAAPLNGDYELTLSSFDPGTEQIDYWSIQWGDGGDWQTVDGTTFSVTHCYTGSEGSVTIRAKAWEDESDEATAVLSNELVVTVTSVPQVTLGTSGVIEQGHTIDLAGSFTASYGPWTGVVDYGDGSGIEVLRLDSDKTFSLSHQFTEDGTFPVTVVISDANGVQGVGQFDQVVNAAGPDLSVVAGPAQVNGGADYTLGLNTNQPISQWIVHWTANDVRNYQGNVASATYQFPNADAHYDIVVEAVVNPDDSPVSAGQAIAVDVSHAVGTASIQGGHFASVDEPYVLSLPTTSPDGEVYGHWTIDWGDDSGSTWLTGNPSQATHTYRETPAAGHYTIAASAFVSDQAHPAGTLDVSLPAVTLAVNSTGQPHQYAVTFPTSIAPAQWVTDWGDGMVESFSGTVASALHVYRENGTYTVRALACLGIDSFGVKSAALTINDAILVSGSETAAKNTDWEVFFFRRDGRPLDTGIWQVDWGNGDYVSVTGNKGSATHSYTSAGRRTVTVRVSYDNGTTWESGSSTVMIDPPVVSHPVPNTVVQPGTPCQIDLAQTFSDPGGQALQYSAWTDNPALLNVGLQGSSGLSVQTMAGQSVQGTVYVSAVGGAGCFASLQFQVSVGTQSVPPVNNRPNLLATLPDVVLDSSHMSQTINLAEYFADVEEDPLQFDTPSFTGTPFLQVSRSGDRNTLLTLTAVPGPGGSVKIKVTASDGKSAQPGWDTFQVTVSPLQIPARTEYVDEGTDAWFSVAYTDFGLPGTPTDGATGDVAFSLLHLPTAMTGATIAADGTFTWTPTEADGGRIFSFEVIATADGRSSAQPVRLVVREQNQAPQITSTTTYWSTCVNQIDSDLADQPFSFVVEAEDPDGPEDTLSYSLASLPAGMEGASIDSTGHFSWTPSWANVGSTYTFSVCVTDRAGLSTSESQTIEVFAAPYLKNLTDVAVHGDLGTRFQIAAAGEYYGALSVAAPAGLDGSLAIDDQHPGFLRWTPDPDATTNTVPGTYQVAVTASAGGSSVQKNFTLTVASDVVPPLIYPLGTSHPDFLQATIDPDNPTTLTVSLHYDDRAAPNYALVEGPSGATVTAAGLVSWTPGLSDINRTHDFVVEAGDSATPGHKGRIHFAIAVSNADSPPAILPGYAHDCSVYLSPGATYSTALGGGIYIPEVGSQDQILFEEFPAEALHGTVEKLANGGISYTPDEGYVGADAFDYRVEYWSPSDPNTRGSTNLGRMEVIVGSCVEVQPQGVTADENLIVPVNRGRDEGGVVQGVAAADFEHPGAVITDDQLRSVTLTLRKPQVDPNPSCAWWSLDFPPENIRVYRGTGQYDGNGHEILREMVAQERFLVEFSNNLPTTSVTLYVEGVEAGIASLTAHLEQRDREVVIEPAHMVWGDQDWWEPGLPNPFETTITIHVVDADVQFERITEAQEMAGRVGFVGLNRDYDQGTGNPDLQSTSLELSGEDDLAVASLALASGGASSRWRLDIPQGLRVWKYVTGSGLEEVVSNVWSAVTTGDLRDSLYVEGLAVNSAAANLKFEVEYASTSATPFVAECSVEDSVQLEVVSADLQVGSLSEHDEVSQKARVPVNADFDEHAVAGASGQRYPVTDNGQSPTNVWVAPGIVPGDDDLVAASLSLNGRDDVAGKWWIEIAGGSTADVRVWFADGTPVPTDLASAISVTLPHAAYQLRIEGLQETVKDYWNPTDLELIAHFVSEGGFTYQAEGEDGGSATQHTFGQAIDQVGLEIAPVAKIFAVDAYASTANTSDDGAFVISRGEGNTSGPLDVPIWFDTSRPDAAANYTLSCSPGYLRHDYSTDTDKIRIPDGCSSVTLHVTAGETSVVDWDRVVVIALSPAALQQTTSPDRAVVTILGDQGVTQVISRNADVVSTGQTQQTVGDWLVSSGVRDGDVTLVPFLGTSAFSPQYVGNEGAYPIVAVGAEMPAGVIMASALQATLHFASLPDVTKHYKPQLVDPFSLYAFEVDATSLPTGHYDYDIVFTAETSSGTFTRTVRGSTEVVNRTPEAGKNRFVDGWWVPGLDQVTLSDGIYGSTPAGNDDTTYRLARQGAATEIGAAVIRSDNTSGWYKRSSTAWAVSGAADDADLDSTNPKYQESGRWSLGTYCQAYAWTLENQQGFRESYRYTTEAGDTATWNLSGVEDGKVYELFTTWVAGPDRASDARYSIVGARRMTEPQGEAFTVTVDQRYVPGETTIQGGKWRSLGFYVATGDTITITLMGGSDGVTVADAVLATSNWQFDTPVGSHNTLQCKGDGFGLRDKYGTRQLFNGEGMQTDVYDRFDNHTQFAYQGLSDPTRLTRITTQGGGATDFQYDGDALNAVLDEYGRKTEYSATTVRLPDPGYGQARPVWTFGYSDHLLGSIQASNGNSTSLSYLYHRLLGVTNGVGATDAGGNSITMSWQLTPSLARLMSTSGGDNEGTTQGPGSTDDLFATYRVPANYGDGTIDWTYTTDGFGYVTALTKPATDTLSPGTWQWQRNADGTPSKYIEPQGGAGWADGAAVVLGALETNYSSYDANGNLLAVSYPNGTSESWTYGQVDSDPLSCRSGAIFSQPTHHHLVGTGVDRWTDYLLDWRGRAKQQTERGTGSDSGGELRRTTAYTYTPAPDSLSGLPGGLAATLTAAYGTADAVTSKTDYWTGAGRVGLVRSITRAYGTALESVVRYDYDGFGNLYATRDEMNRVTLSHHDALGRLVQTDEPNPGTSQHDSPRTQYRYNALGQLKEKTDALRAVWEYEYLCPCQLAGADFSVAAHFRPGTEERVEGAGGGASSPCSPARCGRNGWAGPAAGGSDGLDARRAGFLLAS